MPETVFNRLHPATIVVEFLARIRSLIVPAILFVVLSAARRGDDGARLELILAGFGLLGVVGAVFRYFTFRFAIADGSFQIRHGLVFKQERTIPLERIQNVNLKQGLVERALGVVRVEVETASGTGKEAELAVVAMSDAEQLRAELTGKMRAAAEAEDLPLAPALYQAELSDLILAGATRNRAGLIVAVFFGLFSYAQQFMASGFAENLFRGIRYVNGVARGGPDIRLYIFGVILLGLLFLAGWMVSIVQTCVTHYGFVLRSKDSVLQVSRGLFTKIQNLAPTRRVQSLVIDEPPIQRKLGYCEVRIRSAGTAGEEGSVTSVGMTPICPILPRDRLPGFLRNVFANLDLAGLEWRQVHPAGKRRTRGRGIVTAVILAGLSIPTLQYWAALVLVIGVLLAILYAEHWYRTMGYTVNDAFIAIRSGVIHRRTVVLPRRCVQWSLLSQGPRQRQLGIGSVSFHSAGVSTGAEVTIPDVDLATAEWLLTLVPPKRFGGGV
jgi:putative membrane protein